MFSILLYVIFILSSCMTKNAKERKMYGFLTNSEDISVYVNVTVGGWTSCDS